MNKIGKLYLKITTNFGGSGSKSSFYYIKYRKGAINLIHLFNSNEITYIVYGKNDRSIILLEGIWGDNESHFANHRYQIIKFAFKEGHYSKHIIGKTRFKYSSLDGGLKGYQILKNVKVKEPNLLANVNLSNFDLNNTNNLIVKNQEVNDKPIFYIGKEVNPQTGKFKLIGISSKTNVHNYRYLGNIEGQYLYHRQIGDIIIGIKNKVVVTTIYELIPKDNDIGIHSEIVTDIQKKLPFPLAFRDGMYGVNIDNKSISIMRGNNPNSFYKDRILILTTIKQSILSQ